MFNGIIRHQGRVVEVKKLRENVVVKLSISGLRAKVGDSLAVNGACLTIVQHRGNSFTFHVMPETLKRTNLRDLAIGDIVNIEQPMRYGQRVDGHFVSGHVDLATGVKLVSRNKKGVVLKIKLPVKDRKYFVAKGSVAVNGVSLTVVDVGRDWFSVAIIPFTSLHTNLGRLEKGDRVNIEFDILAKYFYESRRKKN